MLHLKRIEENFRKHQIHKTLDQIKKEVIDNPPNNFDQLGDEEKYSFLRLKHLINNLNASLDKADYLLTPEQLLNEFNNDLVQIKNNANSYKNNPSANYGNLNTSLFALGRKLHQLMPISSIEGLSDALRLFVQEMSSEKESYLKTVQDIKKTANDSSAQFNQTEQKLNELKTEIDNQKTRLDKMLNEQTTTFNNAETTRNQNFTKAQQQQKSDFEILVKDFSTKKDVIIASHTSSLNALSEESSHSSESLLSKIQEQLDKAEEIVGTLVKTSLSGTYKQIANRELWSAWIMRGIAMAAFIALGGMVVWAVKVLNLGNGGVVNWDVFAVRISFGLVFAFPGIYFARESSRHWSAEKHNRRLALELATFDPFLVHLDDKERKALIAKKADEYFGNKNSDLNDENLGIKDVHLKVDQFLKIAERISKIVHPSGTK